MHPRGRCGYRIRLHPAGRHRDDGATQPAGSADRDDRRMAAHGRKTRLRRRARGHREDRRRAMTTLVAPRVHDLGGFQVRRAVPSIQARSVGPFVFVDHMGPAVFEPGRGIDVRPHPHIGLATVTYLWAGTIRHRDTLGSVQDIRPGDVNWMTAGRGIAHSERTPLALREGAHPLHGMQTWVALPETAEEVAPEFFHHPASTLPRLERGGALLRVIAGRGY